MAQSVSRRSLVSLYAQKVTPFEVMLMRQLFQLRNILGLTTVFRVASRLGDWPLWVVVGLVLLCAGYAEAIALLLGSASVTLSIVLFKFLKHLTGRPRPLETYGGLTALMAPPDKFSFPSGHTMTAFAVWGSFVLTLPWLAPWILPMAVLIGLSRIFLGLHYPTDVLMGAILGSGAGYGTTLYLGAQLVA